MSAYCNHPLRFCVFAFVFECFILPKDARFYFPSEFFAEIKKLPKFALCLEQSYTIFSNLLLKRSRITTSEKLRAMYIHNWVVPILAQTYSIVYEVCGEPESVGEACAFSFIRCWCSLAKTRKAILQNNILIILVVF